MAERVGALIVELRANAVKFQAEMEKARGSLRRTGGSFSTAERTATRFAAQGLGSIIPGAQGASFALERVIQSTLRAGGAWRLLGQAGVIVGGVLAVAAGVQWLEANIRNWWRLGETVSQTLDRMKKAAEEQKQFAADRLRAVTLQAGLEKQLVQLRGQSAVATLRAIGEERSAEEAALTTRLELIDRERMERQRGIIQSIAQGLRRDRALATNEAVAFAARTTARAEHDATVRKIEEAATQKQFAAWKEETEFLRDQLKERIQARQTFEAQLGAGAPGSAAAGFKAVADLRELVQKRARDIAFLQREGMIDQTTADVEREDARQDVIARGQAIQHEFGRIASVVEATQRVIDSIQFGNFGLQVEEGRQWVDQFIKTTEELKIGVDDLGERLATAIKGGIDKAIPKMQRFAAKVAAMDARVRQATADLGFMSQAMAGGG